MHSPTIKIIHIKFHLDMLKLGYGVIRLDKDKIRQFMKRDKGSDKNAERCWRKLART
jgi:hypothetical protein